MNKRIQGLSLIIITVVAMLIISGCSAPAEKTPVPGNPVTNISSTKNTLSPVTLGTSLQAKYNSINPNILFGFFPPVPSGWTTSNTFTGDIKAIDAVAAERVYRNPSKTNSYVKITIQRFLHEVQSYNSDQPGCESKKIGGKSATICYSDITSGGNIWFNNYMIVIYSSNVKRTDLDNLLTSIDYDGLGSIK